MILGHVNAAREAIVQIVASNNASNSKKLTQVVEAVIDTGYTGDLMLPMAVLES